MSSSNVCLYLFLFGLIWKGSTACTILHYFIFLLGIFSGQKKYSESMYWCIDAATLRKQQFFTWFHGEVWLEWKDCLFLCKPIILFIASIFCKPAILFISAIICSGLTMNIPLPVISGEILFESARAVEMLFVLHVLRNESEAEKVKTPNVLDETESPSFEKGCCRCGMCWEFSCRS